MSEFTTTMGFTHRGSLNERRIFPNRPMKTPVWYEMRVKRNNAWYPAKSLEIVREKDGYIKMDIRTGAVNVRAYVNPELIESMSSDWICLSCGRINGESYSICNGCGKSRS